MQFLQISFSLAWSNILRGVLFGDYAHTGSIFSAYHFSDLHFTRNGYPMGKPAW